MSYAQEPYRSQLGDFAAMAAADDRATFITKTYLHLAGAIVVFGGLCAVMLTTGVSENLVGLLIGSRFGWLLMLGAFILVSHVAASWAQSAVSPATQYAGLGLYVVAESFIFAPLLYIANLRDPSVIPSAAMTTLVLFGALTLTVFVTRKDFSFLRSFLVFGSMAAFGFIFLGMFFPTHFQLGAVFLYAMVALACGYILYDTSNVLHHYRIGQHVAASLALFASVALLFWYVIQIFLSRRD
jgi:FtsH-binding integral membrane protein